MTPSPRDSAKSAAFRRTLLDLNAAIAAAPTSAAADRLRGTRDGLLNDRLIHRHNGKVSRQLASVLVGNATVRTA